MREPARVDARDTDRFGAIFGIGLAVFLGSIVRGLPFFRSDFPLNDGGLFATMIQELVEQHFLLPLSTTYNGLDIPYAYPPLAFYLAGAVQQVTGAPLTDVLRALPFLISLATIPAVYWLAAGILGSRFSGVVAAVAFALVPRAYLLLVPGGGITRATGLLFALLALAAAYRVISGQSRSWPATFIAGILGGLAMLAHPQAAVFVAISVALFVVFAPDRRQGLLRAGTAGVVAVAVLSPWLVSVLARHGPEPLLSAAQSGDRGPDGLVLLASLRFTDLLIFDLITIAGLVGFLIALRQRAFLLPVWLALIWLVDTRAGATFSMVPLSLLAAVGVTELTKTWPRRSEHPLRSVLKHPLRTVTVVAVLAGLVVANDYSSLHMMSPTHALSAEQRAGQAWVAANLPDDSAVAVVSAGPAWQNDASAEWFPRLAAVRSVGTVQGYEWLGAEAWADQKEAYYDLQRCAGDVLTCVVSWSDDNALPITHVFLPKGRLHGPSSEADCCAGLRHSVDLVPGARIVYDGSGATVIELP